ncbi:hypothetical protein M569_16924 [Genlisea aurea]|uniref:HMA domain-containing protein n=1 Tax=Genlisea aurea TaxID=192259 RepID=S8D5K4_9LAMI|nr:hypothetical protein M569_16924 [Genlisea aurea]
MKGLLSCHSPATIAVSIGRTPPHRRPRRNRYVRLTKDRRLAAAQSSVRWSNVLIAPEKTEKGGEEEEEKSVSVQTQAIDDVAVSIARPFQMVVMRVSIHCQGCAAKVKKHLSKMEGVTSFSIDVESQRVTVWGHVSASSVLASVSRVKRAEFWNESG